MLILSILGITVGIELILLGIYLEWVSHEMHHNRYHSY